MASGNQNPSFKTNVNRMKTKKWVEAKSYNYDGDDWGDADEYDEYDGYGEEQIAAPSAAGPAGSRQTSAGYGQDPRQQVAPFPGAPHPAYATQHPRSGSPGRLFAQDPRGRTGSFDSGDERRNFSGPSFGSPSVPPLRTAYGAAPRNHSPAGRGYPVHPASPHYGQPGAHPHSRGPSGGQALPPPVAPYAGQESSGRTWSMGSQGSIALAQRGDIAPSSPGRGPQAPPADRPPRKSSMGQASAPSPPDLQHSAAVAPSADSAASRIIRPADIYKRVAEEKERERMSQECGRPSVSDLMREKDSTLSEATAGDGDVASPRSRKQTLDTVAERKSEYATDALLSQGRTTSSQNITDAVERAAEEQRHRFSTSPQLPDISSGFSDDWLSGFGSGSGNPHAGPGTNQNTPRDQPVREPEAAPSTQLNLAHKPSEGFRSVVHQAFDEPVRSNVENDSDVTRSDTTSTIGISPIISPNGSKEQDARAKGLELRAVNMASIAEEGNIGAPYEAGSTRSLKQIDGKAQPTEELPPPGFKAGHRRSTELPSPGNSPARHPKLEVRNVPNDEERADFAAATPVEERENRRRAASAAKASQIQNVVESLAQKAREEPVSSQNSPARAESPTKGRVRDLVGKAESANSSRRGSETSQTAPRPSQERAESFRPQLPGGWNSYVTNPRSPSPEPGPALSTRSGSRPASGIFNSTDTRPSSLPGAAVNPTLLGHGGTTSPTASASPDVSKQGLDIEPTTRKRSLASGDTAPSIETARDPLTAAKAAGVALAGAVTAAAGLTHDEGDGNSIAQSGASRGQNAVSEKGGTTLYPESSRPPMPPSHDSTSTSVAPTPRGYSPMMSPAGTPSEEAVPTVAPLRQRGPGDSASPLLGTVGALAGRIPPSFGIASQDGPLDDDERLRRDIERQLTPNAPLSEASTSHPASPTPSHLWPGAQAFSAPQPLQSSAPQSQQVPKAKPKTLKHKFSWEAESEEEDCEEEPTPAAVSVSPPQQLQPALRAPASALAPGPVVAPSQATTTVRSEPVSELSESPTVAKEHLSASESPALKASLEFGGAKDVTGLSVITSPRTEGSDAEEVTSPPPPPVPSKTDDFPTSPVEESPTVEQQQFQPPSQPARRRGQTLTGTSAQLPAFREILAMKSPEDRLRVYRSTQETFANMNTGLTSWIQTMGERHPEHKPLLNTAGDFTSPTPGLQVAPLKRQQTGAAAGSSSGTGLGFSGLRKAGATAAPSMNEAGAALKSAGRDTKKLAKGLFAKGRSKFGRDKGSSKLALPPTSSPPPKYQPYRPGAMSPPQPQGQFVPYRPTQQPVARTVPLASPKPATAHPGPVRPAAPDEARSNSVQHSDSEKSLPDLPAANREADSMGRPSDVSDLTSSSIDSERMGTIHIALSQGHPEASPPHRPQLEQRLTIHQKDIQPFGVEFPGDLLESDAFKAKNSAAHGLDKAVIPHMGKPGTPKEEEEIPDQPTPRPSRFPTRSHSLSAGRTLDPGVEIFNTTPSWLNFDPAASPATVDLFGLSSPSDKLTPKSAVRSKRASLQIPLKSSESRAKNHGAEPIAEASEEDTRSAETEGRPFSFINFANRPEADFSLNEAAYQVHSRESSVISSSTGDYDLSKASTREGSLGREVSRDEGVVYDGEQQSSKPLPSLPQGLGHHVRAGPSESQFATVPARPIPKVSLFPQSTGRPGTRDRVQGNPNADFMPERQQNEASEQPATMPTPGRFEKHRRNFSGGNLLQRALTAGINTITTMENPKREKIVVKAEKTDKKRRRFSNLNILGKPKLAKRVPIEDPSPPSSSAVNIDDGGMGGLASNTQHFERSALSTEAPRPDMPDPIHVAPIEGYYSPEGDATQTPTASSIPSNHIASQFNDRTDSITSPTKSVSSSPDQNHHSPHRLQEQPQWIVNQSAFNESNQVLQQALQSHPIRSDRPQLSPPLQNQAQRQSQISSATGYSPPSSPPTIKLPHLPHIVHTVEHEPTLRMASSSPGQYSRSPGVSQNLAARPLVNTEVRSINSFPQPPIKSSPGGTGLRTRSPDPRTPDSRSPSSSARLSPDDNSPANSLGPPRRSRGPSLSVDTNLANFPSSSAARNQNRSRGSSGSRERSQASRGRLPAASGTVAGAQQGTVAAGPESTSEERPRTDSSKRNVQGSTSAVTQEPTTAVALRPPPVQYKHAVHERSGPTSKPASATTSPNGPNAATPLSTMMHHPPRQASLPLATQQKQQVQGLGIGFVGGGSGASMGPTSPPPDSDANPAIAGVADVGTARKMTITPATLWRMRQREIELGGETRLTSPEALTDGEEMRAQAIQAQPQVPIVVLSADKKEEEVVVEQKEQGASVPTLDDTENTTAEFAKAEVNDEELQSPQEENNKKKYRVSVDDKEVAQLSFSDEKEEVSGSSSGRPRSDLLKVQESDDEPIVMSATSFPGQEWNPYEQGFY